MKDDGAREQLNALAKRVGGVERDGRAIKTWMLVLVGFVLSSVIVCAFELRHIVRLIERLHGWLS